MIRSYKRMQETRIRALDGEIGILKDVYFDDSSWQIQYFVIELGTWFSGKDVLVPPGVVSPFDGVSLKVELTKAELRSCPHADEAIPVSLQERYRARSFFNLVCTAGSLMNGGPLIVPPISFDANDASVIDPHLRSCRNVSRYELVARDGDVGAIQDLLIDDSFWLIRFVVAIVNGVRDRQAKLFGPQIIEDIEWSLSVVKIGANRNQALLKPSFDANKHLDTSYEFLVKEVY
jgi:hypothetical protein